MKNLMDENGDGVVDAYQVGIVNIADFSPFGCELDGRTMGERTRLSFQGQERDDEIKGEGNSVNYKYRMHDPRVGRFFAIDPLSSGLPWNSPYSFSENSPIAYVELEGLEKYYAADGRLIGQVGSNTQARVINDAVIAESAKDAIDIANTGTLKGELASFMLNNLYSKSLEEYFNYHGDISDVTNGADRVEYYDDCNSACRQQLAYEGVTPDGGEAQHTMYSNDQLQKNSDGYHPQLEKRTDPVSAVLALHWELRNNKPAMVGLSHSDGKVTNSYNYNVLSEHFVVVVDFRVKGMEITFGYLDNAFGGYGVNGEPEGDRLKENRFTYDVNKGTLEDNTSTPSGDNYRVTETRSNRETEASNGPPKFK